MDKEEMVKVTIRLPKSLAKLAKHHAVARDEDLQDLIAAALAKSPSNSLPPAMGCKGRPSPSWRRCSVDSQALNPKRDDRRVARSYSGAIKTKGANS